MTPERIQAARLMRAEQMPFDDIAAVLGVGASSVKRALLDRKRWATREELRLSIGYVAGWADSDPDDRVATARVRDPGIDPD